MKMDNKIKLTGLALTLALSGCATHQRITQDDVRNYTGSVADFTTNYVRNEAALNAAETNRESRCLADLVGVEYSSMANLYKGLSQCVDAKMDHDMFKSLGLAIVIDAGKLFFVYKGLQGVKYTVTGRSNTTTLEKVIGGATHKTGDGI